MGRQGIWEAVARFSWKGDRTAQALRRLDRLAAARPDAFTEV